MSTWTRGMPLPPKSLPRTKATCSDPLAARETRCELRVPDRFEFSVKVQDVAGKVCFLAAEAQCTLQHMSVAHAWKACTSDAVCII